MAPAPALLGILGNEFPPLVTTPLKSKFDYYPFSEVRGKDIFLAEKGVSIRGVVLDVSATLTKDMMSKLSNLEILSYFTVGTDHVDHLQCCKERGVAVSNTPDVLSDDVADLALALTLATLKRISAADRHIIEKANGFLNPTLSPPRWLERKVESLASAELE